jgi:Icc-related predicted phosphoesterase
LPARRARFFSVSGRASRAWAAEAGKKAAREDFLFVQLSDTYWGFNKPEINPDPKGTLPKALDRINAMTPQPDFVVFTGDLTHTTDDEKERRERLKGFLEVAKTLKVKELKFLAGEHDAALDEGTAYKEVFGETHYTFDHKGVHFIAVDNVSDPSGAIGDAQLQWLEADLKKCDPEACIVVLTHRPLFDLAPAWDWTTRDGAKAIDLLTPFKNVTVLYGHIHQDNQHMTGNISHHACMGMMYPLPAPMSVPKKAPVPWDPKHPYRAWVTGRPMPRRWEQEVPSPNCPLRQTTRRLRHSRRLSRSRRRSSSTTPARSR